MNTATQRDKAEDFRKRHHGPGLLVLPNAWDAASARVLELAGFPAIATTSSGVATALGSRDGQRISRDLLVETTARITRVVNCPVSADIEAGYGDSLPDVLQTVRAIIGTGAIGINIEDSLIHQPDTLTDLSYQVELIRALRALAGEVGVPFVINARVDVYLHAIGAPETRFAHTVQRANAYLQAGADCVYPIGALDRETIAGLVQAISGPVNIMGGPPQPTLPELEALGVARVSLAGGLMRAALGRLRTIARELRETGTYDALREDALSSAEFRSLVPE